MREVLIPVVTLAWLALGVIARFPAGAAPAETAATSPASILTTDLNYQETDEVLVSRQCDVKPQTAAFTKEPPLGKKNVLRGFLLGGEQPDRATAYIWDRGNGRLYLDLNRNRDLTDDPTGVFASTSKTDSQSFTNIHWVFPAAAEKRSVRLQLSFYSYQASNIRVSAGLCYYWHAKVSLGGSDWQLGVVEDYLGEKTFPAPRYLLLRPWAERQRPFHLTSASPDFCDFTTNLFFGNHAYALDWRHEAGGEAGKYRVSLTEQAPRLGELNVSGADLHRLILLENRGLTVILDQPQGTMRLPLGSYSLEEIWLRRGDLEASRFKAGRISVDAKRPATLVAGGPLTNSVAVNSAGHYLQLNYRLLGAAGGEYQIPRSDDKHPPELQCSKAPIGWRPEIPIW